MTIAIIVPVVINHASVELFKISSYYVMIIIDRFCIALLSALGQIHCAFVACHSEYV